MKKTVITILQLVTPTLFAAVPLSWTVETSCAQPATFEAYQGETLTFEAALQSHGKPLEAPLNYSFFWQTNGMGSTYWEAPCTPPIRRFDDSHDSTISNVLFATFTPSMDVGAKVYNCFIGSPSNIYHAAFQLRLRPSPGATPNALPLPTPVIDFAKVRVLNPPWSGGGGGGVDTNSVIDIIHATVDGAARPLPKYLHLYNADDSYPDAAAEYYRQRGSGIPSASCSSVRSGGYLYRNFDYPFDDRAEFVVKMSAGTVPSASSPTGAGTSRRFASVGVAQVGTNLTEQMVTSGKPEYSRLYKWLPGATVDGINENGVACNINVVDGDPQTSGWHNDTGDLHPLAAVRWILDNATNAQQAAEYIASHIAFPQGWTQNFHYMVASADPDDTWIVENGRAVWALDIFAGNDPKVMTNFRLYPRDDSGVGQERFNLLYLGSNITNAWYTHAYRRETNPPWVSDLAEVIAYTNEIFNAWETHPKEYFRNKTNNGEPWWQTVHTSVYDISNRVLRVAVQETDDWYTFQVPSSGAKVDAYTKSEIDAKLAGKLDGPTDETLSMEGAAADAKSVRDLVSEHNDKNDAHAIAFSEHNADTTAHPDKIGSQGGTISGELKMNGEAAWLKLANGATLHIDDLDAVVVDSTNDLGKIISSKADRSMISATNPTFSNEVATVARTVTPPPSPTLRLYDEVRQCYWLGKMVNGVMQWEVE